MAKPRIHLLESSGLVPVEGWRVADVDPAICPTPVAAHINPETTTTDPAKVTCKKCLAKIEKAGR